VWHERDRKPDRVSKRKRMAQRADKWRRSVWHVQMLMTDSRMSGRGIGFDVGAGASRASSRPETLTTDVGRAFLKAQSPTKTKSNLGRSEDTNDGDTR
jgi:hypothetical protein